MNYLSIEVVDSVNGEGLRTSLFVAGCSHACSGCFNKESWDYKAGVKFDSEAKATLYEALNQPYISGLSILGGDPLADKNFLDVCLLCASVKTLYPDKTIWLWTGYTLEEILDRGKETILKYLDVLVDGKFEEHLKDTTTRSWVGSSNQRVINLKETGFE